MVQLVFAWNSRYLFLQCFIYCCKLFITFLIFFIFIKVDHFFKKGIFFSIVTFFLGLFSFCEMGGAVSRLAKKLFPKNQVRIVMVGLDASGKTTILYKLKLGDIVTTVPTIGI